MNDDTVQDLKQFIAATISQQTANYKRRTKSSLTVVKSLDNYMPAILHLSIFKEIMNHEIG